MRTFTVALIMAWIVAYGVSGLAHSCTRDDECNDGNPCTQDSCALDKLACVYHISEASTGTAACPRAIGCGLCWQDWQCGSGKCLPLKDVLANTAGSTAILTLGGICSPINTATGRPVDYGDTPGRALEDCIERIDRMCPEQRMGPNGQPNYLWYTAYGTCPPWRTCTASKHCEPGRVCGHAPDREDRYCVPKGKLGDPCTYGNDCWSGTCGVQGTCRPLQPVPTV